MIDRPATTVCAECEHQGYLGGVGVIPPMPPQIVRCRAPGAQGRPDPLTGATQPYCASINDGACPHWEAKLPKRSLWARMFGG